MSTSRLEMDKPEPASTDIAKRIEAEITALENNFSWQVNQCVDTDFYSFAENFNLKKWQHTLFDLIYAKETQELLNRWDEAVGLEHYESGTDPATLTSGKVYMQVKLDKTQFPIALTLYYKEGAVEKKFGVDLEKIARECAIIRENKLTYLKDSKRIESEVRQLADELKQSDSEEAQTLLKAFNILWKKHVELHLEKDTAGAFTLVLQDKKTNHGILSLPLEADGKLLRLAYHPNSFWSACRSNPGTSLLFAGTVVAAGAALTYAATKSSN